VLHGANGRWAGALFTASDGRAEPSRAAPAIARASVRAGARIVSHCAVRSIESAASGHAVITEYGAVNARIVVCAASAWTSRFCRALSINVPQLRAKGTVARTAPTEQIPEGQAWCPTIAIRRRADGGYTVAHGSAFYRYLGPDTLRFALKFLPALRQEQGAIRLRLGRDPIVDPRLDARVLGEMRSALHEWFPEIASAPFVETWAVRSRPRPTCCRRSRPAKGAADSSSPSASAATVSVSAPAGALVARMVTGRASAATLAPFRLTRFFDGSPIVPGPTI
jgi:glycine/D-amino acid oxidase-like deaminating enzyme